MKLFPDHEEQFLPPLSADILFLKNSSGIKHYEESLVSGGHLSPLMPSDFDLVASHPIATQL